MLRTHCRRLCSVLSERHLRDIVSRLDSFEKEIVALKEFRSAVERTSPEVAAAAAILAEEKLQQMHDIRTVDDDINDPLNAAEFEELYQFYALQSHRTISVDSLLHIRTPADLIAHGEVLHREILIRSARRAVLLHSAPYGLARMPSIEKLRKRYEVSFREARSVAHPVDFDTASLFGAAVRRMYLRHNTLRPIVYNGLQEFSHRENLTQQRLLGSPSLSEEYSDLEGAIVEFIDGRERFRFLLGNYVYLTTKLLPSNHDDEMDMPLCLPQWLGHDPTTFCGQICRRTSMARVVQEAVDRIRALHNDDDDIPNITVDIVGDKDFTFVGIPLRISELVTALLGKAFRDNLKRSQDCGIPCTAIHILISQGAGNSDVVVRVSDTAGGIPLHEVPLSQQYLYCCDTDDSHIIDIPTAIVSAKAIGGDIFVHSVEGHGTDRSLYLPVDHTLVSM